MKLHLLLLLPFLGAALCSPPPPPPPDVCSGGKVGAATSLELGGVSQATFVPVGDSPSIALVHGTQGADMVGVRYRFSGDIPACMKQRSRVVDGQGNTLYSVNKALNTYADANDTRTTRTTWFPLPAGTLTGETVRLEVEAGGLELRQEFRLEEFPYFAGNEPLSIDPGGDGVYQIALYGAAPPGGMRLHFTNLEGDVEVLREGSEMFFEEGATTGNVLLKLSDTPGFPGTGNTYVTAASIGGESSIFIRLDGATSSVAPVFNEVYAPSEGSTGDANCDGNVDAGDTFIELYNGQTAPYDLGGRALKHDSEGESTTLLTFDALRIGPKDTLLVIAKAGTGDCHEGKVLEAPALAIADNAYVYLDSSGELHPTRGTTGSLVRSPEFTGPLVDHSDAESGLVISPGFAASGAPFADEHLP